MNIFGLGKSHDEQPPVPTATAPATSSATQPIPAGGFTIEDVVAWLQGAGYSAKVVTSDSGKRHVVSATQGTPFNVFMGDCNGERCASIEFSAGFSTNGKFDIAQVNDWNNNNRWCRAYYDSVNDPWLDMDVDLYPGGTFELLNDQFATWNVILARFIKQYGLV